MNDIMLTIVLAAAIACMYIAQRKSTPKSGRHLYSLLGSVACILIAVEGERRDQTSIAVMFTAAALISLLTLVLDFLKPSKPDA